MIGFLKPPDRTWPLTSPLTQIADAMAVCLREKTPRLKACVERVYDVVVEDEEELLARLTNDDFEPRIFVAPLQKTFDERADRSHDRHRYAYAVIVAWRPYEIIDTQGRREDDKYAFITIADEFVSFVNENVYKPLASTEFAPVEGAIIEAGGAAIDIALDYEKFNDHGILWSELSFTYTLDEPNH